ncbi:hypothetical protein D515_01211 [Grimontia indica]|uniref:DUF3540 domain-containing protein n=1 Tax=Grimontia indica TaxID=1056512 RepID=R1GUL0_9GAMM|nr:MULTISPECIES: DUF3540 domain-containing protein [Grimontia]EOD79739.1 hypothetical protein D515_01211 [Grimontia indica]
MVVSPLKTTAHQREGGLASGIVNTVCDGAFTVTVNHCRFSSNKAAGCLLVPEAGDTVLLAILGGKFWILDVLEKSNIETANISFPGSLNLHTGQKLTLSSLAGLTLQTPAKAALVASEMNVKTQSTHVQTSQVKLTAEKADVALTILHQVIERAETYTEWLISKLGRCIRTVREHDEQRSGSYTQRVEGSHVVESENSVHIARKHMAMDAKKIHLG